MVVGDKPGDADVTVGLAPDDRCLKIGFFDHSHEHPHPDLPPLPPRPPPPPEAAGASNGGASGNDGRSSSGVVPRIEGLGFLSGANRPLLLERDPSTSGAAGFLSNCCKKRIQGRPGSQGGGEVLVSDGAAAAGLRKSEEEREPGTAVAADEMLLVYGDSFDVVACGGHSMDLVADFVRHFIGTRPPDGAATA